MLCFFLTALNTAVATSSGCAVSLKGKSISFVILVETKPGNIETEKRCKILKILFQWFPAGYLVFLIILFTF